MANLIKTRQHNKEIVSAVLRSQILAELPKTHSCCECGKQLNLSEYRVVFGRRFCSIDCEDIGEEKNQGRESVSFKDYE